MQLRREGVRARSGPLTITAVMDPAESTDPPRVAFAISRRVGNAVARNRLRRRLRAVFAELAGQGLQPGAYLVSAQPNATELSYSELRSDVQRALNRLNERTSQGIPSP